MAAMSARLGLGLLVVTFPESWKSYLKDYGEIAHGNGWTGEVFLDFGEKGFYIGGVWFNDNASSYAPPVNPWMKKARDIPAEKKISKKGWESTSKYSNSIDIGRYGMKTYRLKKPVNIEIRGEVFLVHAVAWNKKTKFVNCHGIYKGNFRSLYIEREKNPRSREEALEVRGWKEAFFSLFYDYELG